MFTPAQIRNFTKTEVCNKLDRAIYISIAGTEGMFLSDRLEPWIELARPIQHNRAVVVYYWPELEI